MASNKQHAFGLLRLKRFSWAVCGKCGLIMLHNKQTQQKANRKCPGAEHSDDKR